VAILDFYAQACFAATGDVLPPSAGGLLLSRRRPYGVAGLITPWNFPLAIPLWKAAPALAAGNAVLIKPSPDASACAARLAEILGSSLPAGVLGVAHGAAATGGALVEHADIVSFTGSAAVGRRIAVDAAARGIPVQCEMGGHNAAIVLPDAEPDIAASIIAAAATGYAGQKCTATRRVIVVDGGHRFLNALADAVAAIAPASPDLATTTVGPVISDAAKRTVEGAVDDAVAGGGRVLAGGHPVRGEGWYVQPTLVDGLAEPHRLLREETFGPLVMVQHADDLAGAIGMANAVPYGLVTSVHGRDLDAILAAVDGLDTGMIKINAPTTGVDFYAPFGGEKESSYGPREQGLGALDFYSSSRTITVAGHRS
jgi:alpha-ketoglutaric semialdehyde dehydrogenase